MVSSYKIGNMVVSIRQDPSRPVNTAGTRDVLEKLCMLLRDSHNAGGSSNLLGALCIALDEYDQILNKQRAAGPPKKGKVRADFATEEEYLDHIFSYKDPEGDEE